MGELATRMAGRRLEDLVAIADSRPEDGFEPEVIEAARHEIAARGVDAASLSEVQSHHEALQNDEGGRSEIPLSHAGWLGFAAIGPLLILSVPLALSLRTQGFRQKGKDAFGAIVAGFLIWAIGLPAVLFALDRLGIA